MGIAAYNRGSKVLRLRLDMEAAERESLAKRREIFCHEWIDWRNGETYRVWCDAIGALANQQRDENGKPL